MHITVLA